MDRAEAKLRVKTHPYPDTRDGKKKIREVVWVDCMYGQPCEEYAENQRRKCLEDYEKTIPGFFCDPKETGTFVENASDYPGHGEGYGDKHIMWRYWIHYAMYQ